MAIAKTLINYLKERGIDFEEVEHDHTSTAEASAHAAHVPAHQVAKAVVLRDGDGYVVSVLPANHSLEIGWVNDELGRNLEMACEDEFKNLFGDCEVGAVPALGEAYGLKVIWDDQLKHAADIYIEAGDHEHLIHLSGEDFRQLMARLPHSVISAGKEYSRWVYG